ncbi:MAG: flagellar assembly protein FliW [Acetanaerobacterium sp.]
MNIQARDFGSIDINECDILVFPKGILAFEEYKRYILIHYPHEDIAPMWLQSVDNSSLCFIVFDPFLFFPDYAPAVSPADAAELGTGNGEDLRYFAIAVVPEDAKQSTINLKSPLVVNVKNNRAMQCILDLDYPVRFPLLADKGEL